MPPAKEISGVAGPGLLALMGPKGIPRPIIQRIQEATRKETEDPEFAEVLKRLDMAVLYQNAGDYEKFVQQDFEDIGKVVKALGLDKK